MSDDQPDRPRPDPESADPSPELLAALARAERDDSWDVDRAWSTMRTRMRADGSAPARVLPMRRRALVRAVGRIAAVALVGAGLVATARVLVPRVMVARRPAVAEARTGVGERREVRLADGTRVTLAPGSRLRWPDELGANGARDVTLEGEAFFVVAHDASRPFSVHAGGAVARVLGTEFDVRARDRVVQVVVATGRVQFRPEHAPDGPVLEAGDLGRLDAGGRTAHVTRDAPLYLHLGWREGRLVGGGRPFAALLPELTRWFGDEFVVADSALAARPVVADLRVGPGARLDPLLDALALALDARWSRQGRTVTFLPSP
jgi:transmembrane sensor